MLWAKEESEQGKTAEWFSKLNVKKESERYESGLKPNFSHKPFYTESRLFHTYLLWGFLYSCKGQIPVTVKDEICELEGQQAAWTVSKPMLLVSLAS